MNPEFTGAIIAGPCSVNTKFGLEVVADALSEHADFVRLCWRKPRTRPGWEGVGVDGLPMIADIVQRFDLSPAMEAILPGDVGLALKALEGKVSPWNRTMFWLGARTGPQQIQKQIASELKGVNNSLLMIKNHLHPDPRDWLGSVEHVLSTGFPSARVWLCHRGFFPSKNDPNPRGFRNLPDWEMAMWLKQKTGMPMIIDLSHIAGGDTKVLQLAEEVRALGCFDGVMAEVDNNPSKALTDPQQQLDLAQFGDLLRILKL